MKYYICILSLIIITNSCDCNNKKLIIINKSGETISYTIRLDTVLTENISFKTILNGDSAFPHLTKSCSKTAWEFLINNNGIDSSLNVYIYDNSSLLKNKKTLLKPSHIFKFKVTELEDLKWKINLTKVNGEFSLVAH